MTYVNGDVYEGDWVENAREGHGTYWKHEYGRHRAEYVGEWRRGKREGFGVFHDELGQRFEGDWVRSKRHGRGRQTAIANAEDREYQTDGSYDGGNPPGVDLYEGDWVEDRMTGEGVMSYANGGSPVGGWMARNTDPGRTCTRGRAGRTRASGIEARLGAGRTARRYRTRRSGSWGGKAQEGFPARAKPGTRRRR